MNKKLLTENLAKKVKSLVVESALSEEMQRDAYDAIMEYRVATNNLTAMPTKVDLDRAEFATYYKKWDESTILIQSLGKIIDSPYFKSIVKMGKRAVPYILECIRKQPDIIVLALEPILGYSVLPKDRKIIPIDEQCEIWSDYFKKNKNALSTEIVS